MGSIGHRLRVNRYTEENERKLTIKRRLIYDGLSLAWMNEWKGSRSALSAGGEGEEKMHESIGRYSIPRCECEQFYECNSPRNHYDIYINTCE